MKVIKRLQDSKDLLLALQTTEEISLDIESSSLDPHTGILYIICIGIGEEQYVLDCLTLSKREITYFISLIKDKYIITHNGKLDIKFIKVNTGVLLSNIEDTMLAEVLIYQGVGSKFYSYEDLVYKYCSVKVDKSVRESFYSNGILTELTEQQYIYSSLDVRYLKDISVEQHKLISETGQSKVYALEMKVVPVVASMELEGVCLDKEHWNLLTEKARDRKKVLEEEIKEYFLFTINFECKNLLECCDLFKIPIKTKGKKASAELITDRVCIVDYLKENINISSPLQLKNLLNLLGLKIDSVNEKIIKDFREEYGIINKILEYKEMDKKASSFGKSFTEKINPKTGRIHSEFNQLFTDTGRFSSSKPNLQQIVKDSEYRECFPAPEGYKMIVADYSQQELRLAGALSGEPKFIEAYKNNIDIHTLTASLVYHVPMDKVTKDQRRNAKTLNFAILYGSTYGGLVYNFGFKPEEAHDLIDNFYKAYPVLAVFKREYENAVVRKHFSSTLLGRKRFFEKKEYYLSSDELEKHIKSMKRQGFNQSIQGAGSDITKQAMCNIFYNNPFGDDIKIIMCIHDEIVCIAKENIAELARNFIVTSMLEAEDEFLNGIPSSVESEITDNWRH